MLRTDLDKPGCSRTAHPPTDRTAAQQTTTDARWTGLDGALLRQLDAACAAADDLEAVTEF
jgi:hypothetical protein